MVKEQIAYLSKDKEIDSVSIRLSSFQFRNWKRRSDIGALCSLARVLCSSANKRKTILAHKPQLPSRAQLSSIARNYMQCMYLTGT